MSKNSHNLVTLAWGAREKDIDTPPSTPTLSLHNKKNSKKERERERKREREKKRERERESIIQNVNGAI
jgi:hypothetical protein